MSFHVYRSWCRCLGLALVLILMGCERHPANPAAGPVDRPSAERSALSQIPFGADIIDVLIDDVDGDGRLDIAFTSHGESFTQVFYQRDPRRFAPGPRVTAVGFHPGQLLRLPDPARRLYLMHAEGQNLLKVFEPAADGGLSLVSELPAPSPRSGTLFHWSDWGLGLAFAPFDENSLFLIQGLDPVAARKASGYRIELRPKFGRLDQVVTTDLEGNGKEVLVFVNSWTGVISTVRRPQVGKVPEPDDLWTLEPGSRPGRVLAADVNQDGHVDLLVPDTTENRKARRPVAIHVLLNDGQGRLSEEEVVFPSRRTSEGGMTGITGFSFGVDRDGFGYALAAGYEKLALYRFPAGWKTGPLEVKSLALPKPEGVGVVVIRDLDGDGSLDLLLGRPESLIVYGPLWENFAQLKPEDFEQPKPKP